VTCWSRTAATTPLNMAKGHQRDHRQEFYAGLKKPREVEHDSQVYRAYLREAGRLAERGARIDRVELDYELKGEYQQWLHERDRDRDDADGRPDREPHEIEEWAHDHDLPYFEDHGSYCPPVVDASYNKLGCVSITLMRKPLRRPRLTCTA
jgi:hypothetical protein